MRRVVLVPSGGYVVERAFLSCKRNSRCPAWINSHAVPAAHACTRVSTSIIKQFVVHSQEQVHHRDLNWQLLCTLILK